MRVILKRFEQVVVVSLIAMMAIVILVATAELALIIYKDLSTPPYFIIETTGCCRFSDSSC